MGRKKIQISRITDERNRQVTFNKRKFGVMKKAYELSVLCDCEIALIIFSSSNKLYQYASTDMDKVLLKYTEYNEPHESLTNKNIIEVLIKKENKNGVMSPDSPEQETDYTLTPRTEAKYNKIEEDFQMVMQRTQMTGGARNMTNPNYTLPVSMPVGDNYGGAMLQASPQMSHTNISPRPSSSETDSVYPSASMLEMSNGYPHSHSPLGGSPSPGPSPGIGGQNNNKSSHHISHKQQSPGGQNGRASNLRVVIPTPTIASNMSTQDDIGYSDVSSQSQSQLQSQQQFQSETLKNTFLIHHQQRHNQTSLNTPVVTLQTPIPALTSYSFPQDFSMSSSDVMSLSSWTTHQGLVQHNSLPHLAVSNSTPPPATSPISIKVKSEPVSPPRDLSSGQSGGHSSSQHQQHQQQHSSSHLGQSSSGALSITTMNTAAVIAGGGGGGGGGSSSSSSGGHNSSATNLSVLSHQQQHLVMSTSRPSSTGHLTPTPSVLDGYCRSQLGPSSRFWNFAGSVTPTNAPSPDLRSQLSDYDSPNQPHKRPRISEGWST